MSTAPPPAPARPLVCCDNCGAPVAGRFCSNCGQRLEPPIHSLWHFTRVATEDLTHADSRLWRTLAALLFKPGYLTRQFLSGRRASYLPPVRLYLVLSVAFFLWLAATPNAVIVIQTDDEKATDLHQVAKELERAAADSPQAAASLAATRRALEAEAARVRPPAAAAPVGADAAKQCSIDYHGWWAQRLDPALQRACESALKDNGRQLSQVFVHNLPRAMFLFLPLLAAAMMLFYWRPRRYYVEHLLFFVHYHAFAFLLLLLVGTVAALLPSTAAALRGAAAVYILIYTYRSMRVVYGQGRARTFAKLTVVSLLYLVSGTLMLALTTLYSALTL